MNVWAVRVFTADRKIKVSERNYFEDQFKSTDGQNPEPSFNEIIDLPIGRYAIEVILYTLPEDFDPLIFQDDEASTPYRSLFIPQEVLVEG